MLQENMKVVGMTGYVPLTLRHIVLFGKEAAAPSGHDSLFVVSQRLKGSKMKFLG